MHSYKADRERGTKATGPRGAEPGGLGGGTSEGRTRRDFFQDGMECVEPLGTQFGSAGSFCQWEEGRGHGGGPWKYREETGWFCGRQRLTKPNPWRSDRSHEAGKVGRSTRPHF